MKSSWLLAIFCIFCTSTVIDIASVQACDGPDQCWGNEDVSSGGSREFTADLDALNIPGSALKLFANDSLINATIVLPGHTIHIIFKSPVGGIQWSTEILASPAPVTSPVPVSSTNPDYFCLYNSGLTYVCKSNCESREGELSVKQSTSNPQVSYYDMDCKVQFPEGRWEIGTNSIVHKKDISTSTPSQILASCAFFPDGTFECHGVSDCRSGVNENRCSEAAPWRGRYTGTQDTGFQADGDITTSMSDPPSRSRHKAPRNPAEI